MAINRIVTEKELNYIETLYLYAKLEDFISKDITWHDVHLGDITIAQLEDAKDADKYDIMLEYVDSTILAHAEFIGEAKGRKWYKLDNYRLGIMDWYTAKRANQFNVEIQYTQKHLFSLEPKLKGLDLPFDGEFEQYHIKRIDVTQIVKTPDDYLTNKGYVSAYRTESRVTKNRKTETVYLGHRKNGNVFRMYNKTIELLTDEKDHPIDHEKIELFSKYFGDIEDLYTFELELHRKYLKPNYGIETLDDLEKVYSVYHEIVGKIRIYEDNDENKKHVILKHYNRIEELHKFTEYKEFKRLSKKKYKPSKYYAIDKAVHAITGYERSMGNLTDAEKILMIDEIANKLLGKDVDIHIQDGEYEEMEKKHNLLRFNQDNSLEVEAYRAFKKFVYNPNPFLE